MVKQTVRQNYAPQMRKFIREELEIVKSDVREAYSIQAQINLNKGYEPSERDLELIEEQAVNLKLTEKLEKMLARVDVEKNTRFHDRTIIHKSIPSSSKSLLDFFYIVRLAQQGFFYLISGAHPSLEPQAVQYVCDTLISNSIRESRSIRTHDRAFYAEAVWEVYTGLVEEKDEPVGRGFKTTYKEIMDAAHILIDRSIADQPRKEKDSAKASTEPPQFQPQPPVWFVMPYTSMIDSHMFALPGTVPTLPYPQDLYTLPLNMQPTFSPRRDQGKSRNTDNKKPVSERENDGVQVNEDAEKPNSKDNVEKEAEVNNNEEESDEEDRFADPDMSDDEEEEEEEAVEEEQVSENKDSTAQVTPVDESLDEAEVAKANNSWLNFAASSVPTIDEISNHTSPKRTHGYKNY